MLEDLSATTDTIEVASAVWCSPEITGVLLLHSSDGWVACPSPESPAGVASWIEECGLGRQCFKTLGELKAAMQVALDVGPAFPG